MTTLTAPVKPLVPSLLKYWYAYVGAFLALWVVLMFGFGLLPEVLRQWRMALVMILGSLVAGSTPMGGGAVSFPFLVLWLHVPPDVARNFGLVIQALGMTSAMIFIFCRRVRVQGRVLAWAVAGAAAGMLAGTVAIAPRVPPNFVKLTFACMWMSFAILTVVRNRELCSIAGGRDLEGNAAMRSGLLVGIVGGIIASIIGVGVELALYTVLVLIYRTDMKIAVPTAVSGMAAASVMGVAVHLLIGDIPRDVGMKFLAAGPIVIFGAPIGTYILTLVPRIRMLYFISALCVLQFVFTLQSLERTRTEWLFVGISMMLAGSLFYWMYQRGMKAAINH